MTIRVVIAEDEAIIRLDLRETLEEEGYEVVGETGRGDKAIELVRSLRPDLAILDIKMPGMDGIDAGALAYLLKPFQKSDLIPAIEVAIGRFRELQVLSGEVDALGEQLEARKIIDRAKGLLIDECGLREHDAFTFIQRTAMSERSRMREVAERILDGTLRP